MSAGLDIGALLAALDGQEVDYVVVGSVAALAHGAPDVDPNDLDIAPATDAANLERLSAALDAIGAKPGPDFGEWVVDEMGEREWVQDGRERPMRPLDPAEPSTFDHSFTTAYGELDVVPEAAGTYTQLRPRASRRSLAGRQPLVADPVDLLVSLTRPRRGKDVRRVRHLRSIGAAGGVGFVGFRTDRVAEMVALFRDRIGLEVIRDSPGATWFRLAGDAELHVYADTDADHAFFTTGPVVGLRVADVETTRRSLEADGLEMLTEIERTDRAAWCHFRAPDGTVMEIIGPPEPDRPRLAATPRPQQR